MFEQSDGGEPAKRASIRELAIRAGLGTMPRSALVGTVVLVLAALGLVGWRLGGAAAGGEFSFEAQGTMEADGLTGSHDTDLAIPGEVAGPIWVHIAGAVKVPGLYEVAPGARVGDALTVAGGPRDDAALDAVNLAREIEDGEQVYVPCLSELEDAGAATGALPPGNTLHSAGTGGAPGTVDINRAGKGELEALPGVGPATADKILADREANGPFTTPEEIMRVPGIGEKKFEAMREMIAVR